MAQSRILIVDDEVEVCHLLVSLLDELDAEIRLAHAADDAMEALPDFAPDLVITDLRMPGGSGFDVLRAAHDWDPDVPVIIITGFGSMETAIEAMRLGAFEYVTKPFNLDEVRLTAERGLESRELRASNRRLTQMVETAAAGTVSASALLATIVRLIQDHGGYKIGQSERVRRHVGALAARAGHSDAVRAQWEETAALSEIGEVHIPVRIWQQREALSVEQWALVRRHPVKGEELLLRSGISADVARAVRGHHEQWNGGGYPDGIAAAAIPAAARAIHIVAAYDAMTTPRPYRKPIPPGEAVDALRRGAGIDYDPVLVGLFVEGLAEDAVAPDSR